MASTKNVQALNNRLELACRNRVGEFYRQHVTSMAQLEHDKLDTARLLQAVRKCPSNYEALSLKFLGPPPKSSHQQRRNRHLAQHPDGGGQLAAPRHTGDPSASEEHQKPQPQHRAPPQTAAPPENPFAPPAPAQPQLYPLERSKTYAAPDTSAVGAVAEANAGTRGGGGGGGGGGRQPPAPDQQQRRSRTPFPNKLEKFYSHLEDTKRSCGLHVADSTQTDEARIFRGTLTRAEWRAKLARLDPEYFKNLANEDTDSESETEPS